MTAFWVRERRLQGGQWIPDVDEAMCIQGDGREAEVLLEGCGEDYRIRKYSRASGRTDEKPLELSSTEWFIIWQRLSLTNDRLLLEKIRDGGERAYRLGVKGHAK